jgi:chromosome segregation ATPase
LRSLTCVPNFKPFLHGVRYIAMPPTKRFRDMEQLSGGEKARALPRCGVALRR